MKIDIEINKEWLEKNKAEFLKNFNDEYRKEDFGKIYKFTVEGKNNEYTVNEDKINIVVGDDNVFVYAEEKPSIQDLINLSSLISKYYNKARTAIEALK